MKLIPCECGCGGNGPPARMKIVRITNGAVRRRANTLYRNARSFRVLPACEKPFMAELRATERCRATAELMALRPRCLRLFLLPRLWHLRRASLVRRMGEKPARKKAWGLVWTALRQRRLS